MRKRLIGKPAWRHSEVKDACVPSVTQKAAKKGETGNANEHCLGELGLRALLEERRGGEGFDVSKGCEIQIFRFNVQLLVPDEGSVMGEDP